MATRKLRLVCPLSPSRPIVDQHICRLDLRVNPQLRQLESGSASILDPAGTCLLEQAIDLQPTH